ncbi:MAG: DUF305 domain-containing protein [Acidimicrobiales bacterium]
MIRTILRLAGLAVIVAGAVVAGTNLTRDEVPDEDSADVGFARDMRAHHAQGVEMAELLRERTENEDLRVVAADIALTQQAQIGQMRGWLDVWEQPPSSTDPPMEWTHGDAHEEGDGDGMPGMASDSEMEQLGRATGERAEVEFLQLMVRHHEGGVRMALLATELVDEGEVEALARTIAESQQTEIRYLTALLTARDADPLPTILPEDVNEIGDAAAADDESDDGWDLVVDWWPVGVAGVVLVVLLRDLLRRPTTVEPSIAPAQTQVATVGEASDDHPDRASERALEPIEGIDRFPSDDSGFDDL